MHCERKKRRLRWKFLSVDEKTTILGNEFADSCIKDLESQYCNLKNN